MIPYSDHARRAGKGTAKPFGIRLLAAVGLCFLLSTTASLPRQGGGPWNQPPIGIPPSGPTPPSSLALGSKRPVSLETTFEGLKGYVVYKLDERKVMITWYHGTETDFRQSVQLESTAFWPTEVALFGPMKLAVAGVNARENTIVQVWSFTNEVEYVYDAPTPVGEGGFDVRVPVESKVTVYDEKHPSREYVKFMLMNLGTPTNLFVQFQTAKDLYELNTVTGQYRRVLSGTPDPIVEVQPALLVDLYGDRWSGDHLLHGYVYFLFSHTNLNNKTSVIFYDGDRDGELDPQTSHVLTPMKWSSLQLDGSSQYDWTW